MNQPDLEERIDPTDESADLLIECVTGYDNQSNSPVGQAD
jgi:hypothetical protein